MFKNDKCNDKVCVLKKTAIDALAGCIRNSSYYENKIGYSREIRSIIETKCAECIIIKDDDSKVT